MRIERRRKFTLVILGLCAGMQSYSAGVSAENPFSGSLGGFAEVDVSSVSNNTATGGSFDSYAGETSDREKTLAAEEAKLLTAIQEKSGSAAEVLSAQQPGTVSNSSGVSEGVNHSDTVKPTQVKPAQKRRSIDHTRARAKTRNNPNPIAASGEAESAAKQDLIKKVSLTRGAGLVEYDLAVEEFEEYYRDLDESGEPQQSMREFVDTTVEGVSDSAVIDSAASKGTLAEAGVEDTQREKEPNVGLGAVKKTRVVESIPVDSSLSTDRVTVIKSPQHRTGSGIGVTKPTEDVSAQEAIERNPSVSSSPVSGSIKALSEELARLRAENRRYHSELEALQREYQVRDYQGGSSRSVVAPTTNVATNQAIVGFDYSPVYTGPGRQFSRLMHMQRGDSVIVEYQDGEWIRVNVADGVRAWMRASDIGR